MLRHESEELKVNSIELESVTKATLQLLLAESDLLEQGIEYDLNGHGLVPPKQHGEVLQHLYSQVWSSVAVNQQENQALVDDRSKHVAFRSKLLQ